MIPLVNFLIKIKVTSIFQNTRTTKPKTVILLFKVTFFPSKDFQSPKSSTLGVITGSFVKPFTPVAKKRYYYKNKKYEKNYIFFIILRILFKVQKKKRAQSAPYYELIYC
jgi:hypothetical protein